MKNLMLAIFVSGLLGCATKTLDLKPVPPSAAKLKEIQSYTCNQILMKLSFLEKKAQRLARVQNDNAKTDKDLIAWGWLMYGIPYLWLDGNDETKKQFELVLGEKDALEERAIEKDCQSERVNYHHTYEGTY